MPLGSVHGVKFRRILELWVRVVIGSLLSRLSKITSQEVKWLEHNTTGQWQRNNRTHAYSLTPS